MAVYAMPDHVHLFIGFGATLTISDLVRDVKASSSGFFKEKGWIKNFAWQEGYGAFSYSQSQAKAVVQYVLNQEEHHRKRTFREEYLAFLRKFEVSFEPKYLFEFYDTEGRSNE